MYDIVLFGNVVIKRVLKGNFFYLIIWVECIELIKDRIEIFKLRNNLLVWVRCFVYDWDIDGYYYISEDIVLILWRLFKGVLSGVELFFLVGCLLKYRLYKLLYNCFKELGYVFYGEIFFVVVLVEDISVICKS